MTPSYTTPQHGEGASNAVMPVIQQLNAYNARSLEAFLAAFADDVEICTYPDVLRLKGKEAMRKNYAERFADPILHCVIVNRIVMDNTVIDHERVRVTLKSGPGVIEVIAIYTVRHDKIAKVTFIPGREIPGGSLS